MAKFNELTGEVIDEKKDFDRKLAKEDIEENLETLIVEDTIDKGYKEIVVKPYGKLHLFKSTIEEDNEAEMVYAEEFNLLLSNDKLMTIDELEDNLIKRRNKLPWDDSMFEQAREDMASVIADLIYNKELYKIEKDIKLIPIIKDLEKKQGKIKDSFMKQHAIKQRYLSTTIEHKADQKKLMFRVSKNVKYPDGTPVWNNMDELYKEKDNESVAAIVLEYIHYVNGVPSEVLDKVPDMLDTIGDIVN